MVRMRGEKPPLRCDGEGRLPVRVELDAVHVIDFSRHEGLQVGFYDLPVEGQLHVPVGATVTDRRQPTQGHVPILPEPGPPAPRLAWPCCRSQQRRTGEQRWPGPQPSGPSRGGAWVRDMTWVIKSELGTPYESPSNHTHSAGG